MSNKWTIEEDKLLKEIYPSNLKRDILEKINKPWLAILRRARRLCLHRDPALIDQDRKIKGIRKDAWTLEEESLLKEIYPHNTKEFILSRFNRPWKGIFSRAKSLGLTRDYSIVKGEMVAGGSSVVLDSGWSSEEDLLLSEKYFDTSREELLDLLPGRTWKAIKIRASLKDLNRKPELIKLENVFYYKKAMLEKYGVECTALIPSVCEKSKRTNLLKRGVEYPTQSAEVRDKVKDTVQSRYGVDCVFQSEDIKSKIKSTNFERYGVVSPIQNKEVQEKVKNTNLERYGVPNPFQAIDLVKNGMLLKYGEDSPLKVPEIKERVKNTNLIKYGAEYAVLNPEVRTKINNTNLERYGFISPLKNKEVIKKSNATNLSVYGFINPAKNEEVLEKTKQTNLKSYGYPYTVQVPEFREKGYQTAKRNKSFSKSKPEVAFKEYLLMFDRSTEQHVAHPSLRYVIDYYMHGIDLWVQFDGDYWHGRTTRANTSRHTEKIKKTVERDMIQNENIPNLVRFWSSEVREAIKDGSILDLVFERISSKININLCYQYLRKVKTYKEDFESIGPSCSVVAISDISLGLESVTDEVTKFIERYEWLGNIGVSPKWCFCARFEGLLAGVVLVNEPSSYSKLLGEDTQKFEALIQRGATASWAPSNLGSKLIMFSCNWVVSNTDKRLFVAYGDPSAGEIGAIYQACNFDYLGDTFGDKYLYRHEIYNGGKPFSSHSLNRTSNFKKWCKQNNIVCDSGWFNASGFKVSSAIPVEIKSTWFEHNKNILKESEKIPLAKKHKYALIIGRDRRERKKLLSLRKYKPLPYPKRNIT
jgi:hypothetical protein